MPETANLQIKRLTLYLYLLLAMTALTAALLWGAATRLDQTYLYGFLLLLPLGAGLLITYNCYFNRSNLCSFHAYFYIFTAIL